MGICSQFGEDFQRGFVKFHDLGLADIENVNKKVCHHGLFQCCVKSLYKTMRELADETYGIREKKGLVVRESDFTCCGIQRRKEFIFHENVGTGEGAEK